MLGPPSTSLSAVTNIFLASLLLFLSLFPLAGRFPFFHFVSLSLHCHYRISFLVHFKYLIQGDHQAYLDLLLHLRFLTTWCSHPPFFSFEL